ncbi:hypothetical protein BDW16_0453 [Sphingomonas koreensis]|nr:hypothetical protein BDW16_0453 [Sphingomonas koreensis]
MTPATNGALFRRRGTASRADPTATAMTGGLDRCEGIGAAMRF